MNKIELTLIISFLFSLGILIGFNIENNNFTIQDICLSCNKVYGDNNNYDIIDINKVMDKLEENCNSNFATKQFDKAGWYIFDMQDCKGSYCKSTYTKIEDCYYKQTER